MTIVTQVELYDIYHIMGLSAYINCDSGMCFKWKKTKELFNLNRIFFGNGIVQSCIGEIIPRKTSPGQKEKE